MAFRDPATIKRSASLSDQRFSIMSEEWFSPNDDDHEEEDNDKDLGNCLRLPLGIPLADEDHFSTPPTSPELRSTMEVMMVGSSWWHPWAWPLKTRWHPR